MKLELMVYGRGQDRTQGYQLFSTPSCWTEKMLMTMSRLNEMWSGGDLSSSQPAAFAAEPNPWGKTYMFICMPPPYCCALLRCTRVEGDEPGTWLKEVRNADIWSMEGLCCSYEQRDAFFAMIPSLILWLEQDNSSFYGRLRKNRIEHVFNYPQTGMPVCNPYSEEEPPEELLSLIKSEPTRKAWLELYKKIHFSTQPFHFIYGPLADVFNAELGSFYGVAASFSTLTGSCTDQTPLADPLKKMKLIEPHNPQHETHIYRLRLFLDEKDKELVRRRWELYEQLPTGEIQVAYASEWIPVDETGELDAVLLMAEADEVRGFVKRLGWDISEGDDPSRMFVFHKED